ncbi:MAG: hypothetical protein N2440_06195 [Actinobacteria bacterium]|nr:hypothetical protein [Actinomycetota bacterium]
MRELQSLLKDKRVIVVALIIIIIAMFPVSKNETVTYVGNGGNAGTLEKKRLAPWWLPEGFIKKSIPLERASKEEVKELVSKAYRTRDLDSLKVIERSYPDIHELVVELESILSNKKTRSDSASRSDENIETTVPPSSSAGGTLEARIPAKIANFDFVTESRSILSWLGVFKSKKDLNIVSLEVSIELLGKKEADAEYERLIKAFGRDLEEVRVKGIKAYFVVISPLEARLFFKDGDFFYEFKLNLKGAAANYKETLRKIAEEAYI